MKWRHGCGSLGVPSEQTVRTSTVEIQLLAKGEAARDLGQLKLLMRVGVIRNLPALVLPALSVFPEPSLGKTGLTRMDVVRAAEHLKAGPPHSRGTHRGRRT